MDTERALTDMTTEARQLGDYERRYRAVLYQTYTGLYALANTLDAQGCYDAANEVHEQGRVIHALWHQAELLDAPVQMDMFRADVPA